MLVRKAWTDQSLALSGQIAMASETKVNKRWRGHNQIRAGVIRCNKKDRRSLYESAFAYGSLELTVKVYEMMRGLDGPVCKCTKNRVSCSSVLNETRMSAGSRSLNDSSMSFDRREKERERRAGS